MRLLGRVEEIVVRGVGKVEGKEDGEEETSRQEIQKMMKELKGGKCQGLMG